MNESRTNCDCQISLKFLFFMTKCFFGLFQPLEQLLQHLLECLVGLKKKKDWIFSLGCWWLEIKLVWDWLARGGCASACASVHVCSHRGLSANGAEQDFRTFLYGVWITNLSNSHVDIKEDNINTTSIHLQNRLDVLLMWPPSSVVSCVCQFILWLRRISFSHTKSVAQKWIGICQASLSTQRILHVALSLPLRCAQPFCLFIQI